MKEAAAKPLKIALHAMDSRAVKTMTLFLQGPCKGAAIVANVEEADCDVFDADAPDSKSLLGQHLQARLVKPVIVLSLQDFVQEGVLYLKKPVKTEEMLAVLNQARALAKSLPQKVAEPEPLPASINEPNKEEPEKDIMDLFNDDLYDLISSSTSTWADEPVSQGPAVKLKEVYAPVKQEPKAPEPEPEEQADRDEEKEAMPAEPALGSQDQESDHLEDAQVSAPALATGQFEPLVFPESQAGMSPQPSPTEQASPEIAVQAEAEPEELELKTYVINKERNKTSKHQTAMRLDEQGFDEYIGLDEQSFFDYVGTLDDTDPEDPKQFINADYDPNEYFQGYFEHVLDSCQDNTQPIMLQSSWYPIAVFPLIQEVWLDATDKELKVFAEIKFKNKVLSKEVTVSRINIQTMNMDGALEKFHTVESFLWKLACWTSKGRYPQDIDYKQPVYLRQWPNFTRLLITPHALRIAALLIKGPRTMINIAETLNIKPQYVFVFVSAAYAIGIAGQARRAADTLVQPPDVKPSKGQGLLGRILSKLRSNKA